jgi:hypothetical protein
MTTYGTELKDSDYVLTEGAGWFAVKGFAIRIFATDEGVAVDIYKDGSEMESAITSTYAFDTDLLDEDEL